MTSAASGYKSPVFYHRGKRLPARLIAWEIDLHSEGLSLEKEWLWSVLCGNDRCVSPDHILPIKAVERTKKGHTTRVNRLASNKTLVETIARCKRLRLDGNTYKQIESETGVPWRKAWTYANGNNWTWIQPTDPL